MVDERIEFDDTLPLVDGKPMKDMSAGSEDGVQFEDMYDRTTYWIMMLLGAGLLLPWNVCLNSLDYLGHNYTINLSYYVTLAYVYPQLPLLAIMVKWGNRVGYTAKITAMFFLEGAGMLIMAGFAPVSFWITLAMVFIIGLGTAVLQSSLFGFASQYPPIYNQSLMAGQGVAGILASVLRIITKGSLNDDLTDSALVYFALVTVVMTACIICYILMLRMPFTKRILAHAGHTDPDVVDKSHVKIVKDTSPLLLESPRDVEQEQEDEKSRFNINWTRLFGKIWLMAFCVCFVFIVTFAVFPGEITSVNYHGTIHGMSFLGTKDWWSVILFFIFNIFDTVGRYSPGLCKLFSERFLVIPSLGRLVFVPLFIGAVYWHGGFQNDVYVALVMVVFSLSNGYIASLSMMYGPAKVEPHEREVAGMVMSFFLQFGIFLGSQVALGVKEIH